MKISGLSLVFDDTNARLDLGIVNGQLLSGEGLSTIFLMTLLSSNIEAGGFDSWWGSTYTPYPLGSRLPQLLRSVKSSASSPVLQARDFTKEALKPFVTLGLISDLNVSAAWFSGSGANVIAVTVTCTILSTNEEFIQAYGIPANGGSGITFIN